MINFLWSNTKPEATTHPTCSTYLTCYGWVDWAPSLRFNIPLQASHTRGCTCCLLDRHVRSMCYQSHGQMRMILAPHLHLIKLKEVKLQQSLGPLGHEALLKTLPGMPHNSALTPPLEALDKHSPPSCSSWGELKSLRCFPWNIPRKSPWERAGQESRLSQGFVCHKAHSSLNFGALWRPSGNCYQNSEESYWTSNGAPDWESRLRRISTLQYFELRKVRQSSSMFSSFAWIAWDLPVRESQNLSSPNKSTSLLRLQQCSNSEVSEAARNDSSWESHNASQEPDKELLEQQRIACVSWHQDRGIRVCEHSRHCTPEWLNATLFCMAEREWDIICDQARSKTGSHWELRHLQPPGKTLSQQWTTPERTQSTLADSRTAPKPQNDSQTTTKTTS